MKCLVTGGAGFIGSYLCDELISDGHEVVAVDNEITGSAKNIAQLSTNPKFAYLKFDCSQPLPDQIQADVIFHFASPASPPKYQQYPVETMLVNTQGTYHLLEKAKKWKSLFILASTSEVYGDPLEHPQKESYWGNVNPVGPRSCYDESKRMAETLVSTYARLYGIDGRIIRIFNTYGPRMDINDGRVVTNFLKQVLGNKPLTVYGDGNQTRSFCYVTDLVQGILKIFSTKLHSGEVINLGNPDEMTVNDLAKAVKEITGYAGEILYKPLPQDDPVRRKPDISKAYELLGWTPQVTLKVGLEKTFSYFRT